jgi:hypothetical protein
MPRRALPLLLAAGLAAAVAACTGAASSAPGTPAGATSPGPSAAPGGGEATPPVALGTFTTAWGEAWEALPRSFPLPPGAEPAEPADPAAGLVSGSFVVGGTPAELARQEEADLVAAGYRTAALDGPLEDGSLVLDSVGSDPTCRIQVRVRPLGGTTMIEILYGAACPWP